MKRLISTLSYWSKSEYGDIFATTRHYEERVREVKEEIINNNTEENRAKIHYINAEYIRYIKLKESILK